MTYAPVGIKCPEHASVGAPRRSARPQQTIRRTRRTVAGLDAPATVGLVALNVLVYLVTVSQGGGVSDPGGEVYNRGLLLGVAISENGDWYRLVTSMFLHASILHLAFNMVALYWLGSIVEQTIGTMRFLLVYFASGLAGSAGALLLTEPFVPTVGASGAIFGIMGALLVLEYRATGSFAGPALGLIAVSLAMTFITPNISIGGHLGGLIGGAIAALLMDRVARDRVGAGVAVCVAVGAVAAAGAIAVA